MLATTYERSPTVTSTLADLEAISDPHTRAVAAAAVAENAEAERNKLRPRLYRAAVAARVVDQLPAVEVSRIAGFNRQYLHRLIVEHRARPPRVKNPSKQLRDLGARNQELIDLAAAADEVRNTALAELLATPGRVGPPAGIPVTQLAQDLQVTRQRVYQIRDELQLERAG